jgi:hypothetical protein
MKSQDLLLLLKLVSLEHTERGIPAFLESNSKWEDWEVSEKPNPVWGKPAVEFFGAKLNTLSDKGVLRLDDSLVYQQFQAQYTVRALADSTGISKSEVGLSLQRSFESGLAKISRMSGVPRVNSTALTEFLIHGVKYVFPVKRGERSRGIATAFAAPAFRDKLVSAGDSIPVWPDPRGNSLGESIEPLYKSVPNAVKRDPALYELLAVVDAIRIGQPREKNLASNLLQKLMKIKEHETSAEA